jgi:uncharacterized protein YrrD
MNNFVLHIGVPVRCYDEQCGNLARIAFRSENCQVTDLVLEEGMLLKHSRVLPFSTIQRATFDELEIAVNGEELEKYPEFRETVVDIVPEGAQAGPALVQGSPYGLATSSPAVPTVRQKIIEGVDDNLDLLDKITPIKSGETTIGKVRGLVVDSASGMITHVLVHKGTIFVDEFWLPITKISRISSKGVFASVTDDEIKELIQNADMPVDEWNQMPTEATLDTSEFPSDPPLYESEPPLYEREKPKSETIINNDATLSMQISDALLDNPQTKEAVIEVINDRGVIRLLGTVKDIHTKKAAEEIAKVSPGVISVMNEIVVKGR